MDLYTIKMAAEYGSAGLYAIGLFCFLIYALISLKESLRHFFVTTLVGIIWPIFMIVILLRANRKHSSEKSK